MLPANAQQLRQLAYARPLIAAAGGDLQQHGMGEEDSIPIPKAFLHPPLHLRQPLVFILKLGIDPRRWNVLQRRRMGMLSGDLQMDLRHLIGPHRIELPSSEDFHRRGWKCRQCCSKIRLCRLREFRFKQQFFRRKVIDLRTVCHDHRRADGQSRRLLSHGFQPPPGGQRKFSALRNKPAQCRLRPLREALLPIHQRIVKVRHQQNAIEYSHTNLSLLSGKGRKRKTRFRPFCISFNRPDRPSALWDR